MKAVSRISDAQWRAVEKWLPVAADRAYVRNKLEQIARDDSTPKQRALQQEEIVRSCSVLVRDLLIANPDEVQTELVAQLTRRSDAAKNLAAFFRQIERPLLLRQFEILRLWQNVGGNLGYTTQRKRQGMRTSPPPRGDVISFFQAAWEITNGQTLSAKRVRDIVIVYKHAVALLPSEKISADAEVVRGG
jgi:hypothetical protein